MQSLGYLAKNFITVHERYSVSLYFAFSLVCFFDP